tara:strand:+ start:1994 stop:3253 length:1260 start_codon:yes stop_codon:yes gene_type:complete
MSENYLYERCVIETAPSLKKKGVKNYEPMAAKLCRMRVDEGTNREFAVTNGAPDNSKRTFALELADPLTIGKESIEYPVIAITSGVHDAEGDQKVFIEPSILKDNLEAFSELPVYFNHQRTDEDLIGKAINPELIEMEDGKTGIKMLAQIFKDAAKTNEVLGKLENGDMTHVSIDWFSKDVDVLGEPFATDIRPIEVSFIDNETRTPVCEACTIENGEECGEHREFGEKEESDCGGACGDHEEDSCACDTHGNNSEVENMAEEQVKDVSEAETITEREFASMKSKLEDMKVAYDEINTKHEEALALVEKYEKVEGERAEAEAKANKLSIVNTIIEKEAVLGKLEEDNKNARVEELSSWDETKLEGFSIAMESMPIPEEAERTFGKGKAHDAEESPVEAEETPRMFAMENGKIVFSGKRN